MMIGKTEMNHINRTFNPKATEMKDKLQESEKEIAMLKGALARQQQVVDELRGEIKEFREKEKLTNQMDKAARKFIEEQDKTRKLEEKYSESKKIKVKKKLCLQ